MKEAYDLWVTPAQKAAMSRVLFYVSDGYRAWVGGRAPDPSSARFDVLVLVCAEGGSLGARSDPDAGLVHPGAFYSPQRATERTSAGTAMRCRTTATGDCAR